MNKLRGVTLPKKWLTFDEIKDKVAYPTSQNKIEQLEKYIEVREQEIEELQVDLKEANESITWWTNRFNAVERDNKKLQDRVDFLIDRNDEKEDRIDKAIAYLESNEHTCNYVDIYNYALREEDLLNILKGDNK